MTCIEASWGRVEPRTHQYLSGVATAGAVKSAATETGQACAKAEADIALTLSELLRVRNMTRERKHPGKQHYRNTGTQAH